MLIQISTEYSTDSQTGNFCALRTGSVGPVINTDSWVGIKMYIVSRIQNNFENTSNDILMTREQKVR